MLRHRDPLADPEPLIRRIYSYVAYRVADPSEAEDITADVFLRAVRYRSTYDARKGEPVTWLFGIARRVLADYASERAQAQVAADVGVLAHAARAPGDVAEEAIERIRMNQILRELPDRDRELLSLRFGADLKARQIADILDMETHAVEVALTRAIARVRARLIDDRQSV